MSHSRPRGSAGDARHGQSQRIVSGARSAPYARPEASRMASASSWQDGKGEPAASKQWPPNQLSIRGRSSMPTWIIVANLLRGTSEADIHETFRQFGDIEEIKMRKSPSENHPSIAFEIAFAKREAAQVAIEKLDSALADGRVLQVSLRDVPSPAPPTPAPVARAPPAPAAPAPAAKKELLSARIPTGPKSQGRATPNNGRELLQGNGSKQAAMQSKAKSAPSLQSRLMSAAELNALQRQQARATGNRKVVIPGAPIGPKGAVSKSALAAAMPLSKRITIPLAMRLSEEAKKGGPASSIATAAGQKTKPKRAKAKGKAKSANGMEVD